MFSCKVCAEKDKRVASLEEQITFLRGLVHKPANNSILPTITLEADGIMSGQDYTIETHSESLNEENAAILAERNALLSGEY